MTAVIYARYSSDNQREESIEGQIRECTAFAEKNGITILKHYIDRAYSATTDNRPEFQNMIRDSAKKIFDLVIVWKLDRFARNRYDSAKYKSVLKKNGVKVISATEVISEGAEGIILESVLEGYAEYFSADLSEKVVRGMTENVLKCKFNGGTLPIGYVIDREQHFQIDPTTAPFVLEAFQRYDGGATIKEVRDWFNERGVRNTRGQAMTYTSVRNMLTNRRYIGEYSYRDVVVPDGIPAIVPKDQFERVQNRMEKNKRAPARHKAEDDYLLTTKLFCGYCGALLCGESGTSKTGATHRYYKCMSVKRKTADCHKKSVRKQWIEDIVVQETMDMLNDDAAVEAIISMLLDLQERDNVNLPLYQQQLSEANMGINNLLNAIQQGILTKSTKERLEELEALREELEEKSACEKLAKPKLSAEQIRFWLLRFRDLDTHKVEHRKLLIESFINAIVLYDDKMLLTFNYKEGTKTITFDEASTVFSNEASGSDIDCSAVPKSEPFGFGFFVSYQREGTVMAMKKEKFITVMAVFDHETQLLLEELQNNFEHRYGIDTKTKGIPFHITLGSYAVEQTEEIIARIKDVAGRTEPFAVHFKGLNHFGNVVRYLEPECSEKLLELHQWFDSDYANGFDEWEPHATLYRHAEPTEIEIDAELARKVAELDRARIVGIELGEFFPPKHLIRVSFGC